MKSGLRKPDATETGRRQSYLRRQSRNLESAAWSPEPLQGSARVPMFAFHSASP
jgi:hypothetical protein